MLPRILLFTQPGCLSCEVMRIFLEAKGLPFEERDMELDSAARLELLEIYHSRTTPTLVIFAASDAEVQKGFEVQEGFQVQERFQVIEGFDPDRLDLLLSAA